MKKKMMQKWTAFLLAALLVCTGIPFAAAENTETLPETAFRVEYLPSLGTTPTANTTGVVVRGLTDGVSVTNLVIPETIGGYPVKEILGFSDLPTLETVHIPSGVTQISATFSFRRCPALRAFTVDARNTAYSAAGGVLFEGNTVHTYPSARTDTAYTLPANCTGILSAAFCLNPYLETLTVPAEVSTLYWHMDAVQQCNALTEIVLLTPNIIFENEVMIDCPQNIRLHLSQGCDIPFHKTSMFANCGTVTICTATEFDDYYRTFAPLYGYGYDVCGDAHEPLVIDPDTAVTVGTQDSLSYSLNYETVDGERVVTGVTVWGWNNLSNIAYDLIVPEAIDGYPVTEIDVQGDDRILSLTVPKTVTRLYAADCTLLHTIDVDADNESFCSVNGVVYSKDGKRLVVFPAAHADTAYHILDGTEQIASGAFGSAHIQSLYLPASLTKMDTFLETGRVFAAFIADENNTAFTTQDGILYNKDKNVLLQYPCAKTGTSFTIPASVQYVETGAFYHNYCLSRVAFADGIDSTPIWRMRSNPYAVGQQTGIERVHIPSSVQTISLTMFDGWAAVCTDDLPSAAGNFAAENKLELYLCNAGHTNETKVAGNDPRLHPSTEIGFSCESIYDDDNALIGLRVVDFTNTPEGLYSVDIPETIGGYPVLEIDLFNNSAYAFRNLQGLAVPSTVRYIDPSCFLYCFYLNSIVVDMDNPYYCDIDGVLFTADGKELVTYPAARIAYTYSVPEGTERITNHYAFAFCQYMATLRLPASLTTLPTEKDGGYYFLRIDSRIRRIEADSMNPAFCTDSQGVLYTKDMRTMIRCMVYNAGQESYTVPSSVTEIGNALGATYIPTVVRQGWYTPSSAALRVLIFEDGMTAIPSFTPPAVPGTTTRSLRVIHIPSSVTQIGELHTYSGMLICSDSATSFAAQYAEMYNLLFAVCTDGIHDWFALPLVDAVGSPYRQYITARIGQPIGTLPTPKVPSGRTFLGWYADGERVTENTIVTGYGMTLTAEWDETGTQPSDAEYRLDPPAKLTYREGESFDPTGMALYRRTDGGEWELIATDGFTWSPEVFQFAGLQTMRVAYDGVYVGQLDVTVTENQIEYLLEPPTKLTYDVGDLFDTMGMKLYRRVNGGAWTLFASGGFVCTPNEFFSAGTQTVTVTYSDFVGSVQVYVQDLDYEYKLELPERLTYPVGGTFDPTGMRVLRRVWGGEWEVYADSSFTFTPSVFTKTGSQYVKVTCGSYSANVRVEVSDAGVEYALMPPIKTTYILGETFDPLGLRLLRRADGGDWEIIAEEGFTCTPAVLDETGTCSVTVRYGSEFRGVVKVNVEETAYEYRLDPPAKMTYRTGEAFDPTGMRLMRRADGGDWEVFADSGFMVAPTVFWQTGLTDVIVTYGTFSGTIQVTVTSAEYEYRLTAPTRTVYRAGETFDKSGMQLLRRVNGGEWTVYAANGFICTPSVLTEEGEQTVTVQYGSFTGTVTVTVQPADYEYKLTAPTKTAYTVGDAFDPTGIILYRRVNGGSWTVYATNGFTCTPDVLTAAGAQSVTVQYGSFTGSVDVDVAEGVYEYRLTSPTKTTYTVGDAFDPAGMILYRRVNGGSWTVYATAGFEYWPSAFTTSGTQTVYVFYGGFTGSVNVNVLDRTPTTEAVFTLTGGKASAGETVQVSVLVSNNPGIAAARLSLSYDKTVLTLEDVENGDVFGASAFTKGGSLSAVPYTVLWEDSLNPDHTADGTLVTYTFRVKDDAEEGTTAVTLSYDANSTYNANLDNVTFLVQDGTVTIQNRLPGDANGDGSIDLKDATVLRRYLAGGWNVTVTAKNADVNGDGEVTLKDVSYITRYLAGGWGITLG